MFKIVFTFLYFQKYFNFYIKILYYCRVFTLWYKVPWGNCCDLVLYKNNIDLNWITWRCQTMSALWITTIIYLLVAPLYIIKLLRKTPLDLQEICLVTIHTVRDRSIASITKGANFTGWLARSHPRACVAVLSGGFPFIDEAFAGWRPGVNECNHFW